MDYLYPATLSVCILRSEVGLFLTTYIGVLFIYIQPTSLFLGAFSPFTFNVITICMKRQNDTILKEKLSRSVGAQYATGDHWRNNSRKNEGMEPQQKQYPAVDVTGDRSKV